MNPHQRCLQTKVKYRNEPKQVMPKSEDLSRSLEINAIWTFDTEFPTIFNKSCTYITFKSAVKHRQLSYGYLYMYVYLHEFVQSCMFKHDLTSKGRMTNCCQLLITTLNQTVYGGLYHTLAEMNRNHSFETTGLNYLSFSLSFFIQHDWPSLW